MERFMLMTRLFWSDFKAGEWKYAVRRFNPYPKHPWEMTGFVISFWFFQVHFTRRADRLGRW